MIPVALRGKKRDVDPNQVPKPGDLEKNNMSREDKKKKKRKAATQTKCKEKRQSSNNKRNKKSKSKHTNGGDTGGENWREHYRTSQRDEQRLTDDRTAEDCRESPDTLTRGSGTGEVSEEGKGQVR